MLDLRLAVAETVWNDTPVKIKCPNPAHQDPTASLAVYSDHLHCYGCGWHRNDWDESLALLTGKTVAEAREIAPQFDSKRLDGYRVRLAEAPRNPMPIQYAEMYHRVLMSSMSDRLDWLFERGLYLDTLEEHLIGHTGTHFTIPVFDKNRMLLTIRFRKDGAIVAGEYERWDGRMVAVPKYQGWTGRNGVYLYGEHWLEGAEEAWVCEGELDALLLHQCGLPAVSATNGARQAFRVPSMLYQLFPAVALVVACTDTDRAGEEAAVQVIQEAHGLGMRTFRALWWEGKDVTEALSKGERIGKREVYA